MFIDTHAHLDFDSFDKDRDQVIFNANKNNVQKIINIGVDLDRSKKSIEIAKKNKNIFATVGIHPTDVQGLNIEKTIKELQLLIDSSEKVVAIGEVGLDYYHSKPEELEQDKKAQFQFFKAQIKLAQKNNLPLVIHVRDAYEDAIEILKEYASVKGVMHCFGGTVEDAQRFIELGLHISFTGIITFKNAHEIREVVKVIPLEKTLIETDCPFLAPEPYRGKRNEPAYVVHVAEKIAEVKEIALKEVEEKTTQNAEQLFQI